MRRNLFGFVTFAALLATPLAAMATTFFTDTFGTSTITNATPSPPTATSASYQLISTKVWKPTPSIASGHLKFGIAATTAGTIEAQALFAAPAVVLVTAGDYIQLNLTFTVTAGVLAQSSYWGVGLYNAGGVAPIAGGLNGTATGGPTAAAIGGAQNWQGYVAQIGFTGLNSGFYDRQKQTATADNDQDLVTITGSSTKNYYYPKGAVVGTASPTPSVTLTAGSQYTEVLTYTMTSSNALVLDCKLYTGPNNTGSLLSTMTTNTGTTPLATVFDGLAFGWYAGANTYTNAVDINSISVTGQSSPPQPPCITAQPIPVSVPVGGSAMFSIGAACGVDLAYQWHRHGTNLLDGGDISGATSSTLIIAPVASADFASDYYVTVSSAGNFTTNSVNVSLSSRTALNLVWDDNSGAGWDLATTADWLNGANPAVFNYGDNVTFDDTALANTVTLNYNYLSPGLMTVNSQYPYKFQGSGSIAGTGSLVYEGTGALTINSANSYTGGTLISNASAHLYLNNLAGLGKGPVTLAQAGGQMEIVPKASSSTGINSDFVVADDFTFVVDPVDDAYAVVLNGNLSGTAGKTLTINHGSGGPGTNVTRIRAYGTNTVYNANLNLNDSTFLWTPYQVSGSQTFNGVISGTGALMQKGTTTYLNGANTYSGGTTPAAGAIALGIDSVSSSPPTVDSGPIGTGPLLLINDSTTSLTGSGTILASGGPRTIANLIQYPKGSNNLTLVIGGTNNLTLSGAVSLQGNDGGGAGTNRIIQADAFTTLSGAISDGGLGVGLIKTGTNILALSNAETYTGPTIISNGTLQVNGSLAAGSAVTVATNGTLGGTGTIGGSVTVNAGGAIAPGDSIGTLTIGGSLTLAGNLLIEVNRSASPTSDKMVVSGTLTNAGTGTVTVTNLGPALVQGDAFNLFNSKALANGGALTITGAGAVWTNKLAVNGTIEVQSVIATTPTNISCSVSGTNLTLSWPPNYLTWTLQSNAVSVVAPTNWYAVPNSSNVTSIVIPIYPSKTNVFYRLLRPLP